MKEERITMSWYPNNSASYAGGHPANYSDDAGRNFFFNNLVLAQQHIDERFYNNGNDHHHHGRSSNYRRSSEDDYDRRPISFEEYRRDYYERQSSGDNYHRSRLSSAEINSMAMEMSMDYSPWDEDGWGKPAS